MCYEASTKFGINQSTTATTQAVLNSAPHLYSVVYEPHKARNDHRHAFLGFFLRHLRISHQQSQEQRSNRRLNQSNLQSPPKNACILHLPLCGDTHTHTYTHTHRTNHAQKNTEAEAYQTPQQEAQQNPPRLHVWARCLGSPSRLPSLRVQ